MIRIGLAPVIAGVVVLWAAVRILAHAVHTRRTAEEGSLHLLKSEIPHVLVLICLCVIARVTFFPMETVNGAVQPLILEPDRVFPLRVNLIPFVQMVRAFRTPKYFFSNILGNSLLFVPVGILWPVAFPKLDRFWKVVLAGAGLSLLIEILQLPFAVRATDIDDLILNTAGCMAGYGIFYAVRGAMRRQNPNM